MTTTPRPADRDEILFAFNQSCPVPSAADIIEWCERYPELAEDIRHLAAINRDLAANDNRKAPPMSDTMLARGFSRVLNMLFEADKASAAAPTVQSFQDATEKRGLTVPKLASMLDIDRTVVAALFKGRMLAPARKRFVDAVTLALQIPEHLFDQLHQAALASPKLGHAKSSSAPTMEPQSYEAIVQASPMPDERKRYWLEED